MTHQAGTVEMAVRSLAERRVTVVGDVMLDTYVFGETVRVSREAPVVIVQKEGVEHRLGGAANAAANLAALGIATRVIAVVGRDEAGEMIRTMLSQVGVDVASLMTVDTTTPQKTRIMAGALGTARQQVLRIDDVPDREAARTQGPKLVDALGRAGDDTDVIILSSYGGGVVSEEVIAEAVAAKQAGIPVCADSRYRLHLCRGVTAVSPNVSEAAALTGIPVMDEAGVHRAGPRILEMLQCDACLITRGRAGMTLFRPGHAPRHVDIVGDKEVTDPTGAGDTVIATFAGALAAGLGYYNAMALANCAAGVAVMRVGTATVSPEELIRAAHGHVELEPWE